MLGHRITEGVRCVLFTGQYEHTIDAKQRLAIPAPLRSRWRPDRDGSAWYAVPWLPSGALRLYTETSFEQMAQERPRSLTPVADQADLDATFFGLTERIEMDAAGRVRLPEPLLRLLGLGTDVVVVGAGDKLEIRDRGRWRESEQARLAALPGLVSRIEARPKG